MNRSEQNTEELRRELTSMVRSKFSKPYMSNEVRNSVDKIIVEIIQELTSRNKEDAE